MRISRRALVGATVAAPFVWRASSVRAADPVRIGLFAPLSGTGAPSGADIRDAATMLVKEKNAEGGILGQQIDLIIADDAGRPEEAVNIARRFATRDDVVVAVGSVTSPVSLAASQVFREAQLPQVVVMSTAQRITTQGNQWVFRSAVPDTKLVNDLADFIAKSTPDLKRFGLLYVNDDFGKGGADTFKSAANRLGMQVVTEERYANGDVDFTAQLGRLRQARPDALFEWSRYTEGALIARQMQQLGMSSLAHFGSDSFSVPKYIELAGPAANGVIYPSPFSPVTSEHVPAAAAIIQKFQAALGKLPNYNHVQAYDAMFVAIDGIRRAGKVDRTAVRDAIRTTDFESARGHFTFDEKGDPTFDTAFIKVVDQKETDARR